MLEKGSIYFIENFEYENGGIPTDKLLIILHVNEIKSIIIKALPTSQKKLPFGMKIFHGCQNNEKFSHYVFEEKREIGISKSNDPFSFDLTTYIFFRENISIIELPVLLKYIPNNFKYLGKLNDIEFDRLFKCLLKSKHLKNKIKRELDQC